MNRREALSNPKQFYCQFMNGREALSSPKQRCVHIESLLYESGILYIESSKDNEGCGGTHIESIWIEACWIKMYVRICVNEIHRQRYSPPLWYEVTCEPNDKGNPVFQLLLLLTRTWPHIFVGMICIRMNST